jgi:hypothetical protein
VVEEDYIQKLDVCVYNLMQQFTRTNINGIIQHFFLIHGHCFYLTMGESDVSKLGSTVIVRKKYAKSTAKSTAKKGVCIVLHSFSLVPGNFTQFYAIHRKL